MGNRHIRIRWLRKLNVMGNFPRTCGSEVVDGEQSNKSDADVGTCFMNFICSLMDSVKKKRECYSMTEPFISQYLHRSMYRCNRVFLKKNNKQNKTKQKKKKTFVPRSVKMCSCITCMIDHQFPNADINVPRCHYSVPTRR